MSTPETPPTPVNALPAAEVRRRFLDFFAERGHTIVPSASLIPAGDQTLLFTNSGMVQFKEVFTGAEKRELHARRRRAALPAGRRQAQRLRGGRAHAAPPHPLRDDGQLELRRLLQARGDPLGLGVPHEGARASPPSASPPRPTPTTRSPGRSGATRSACRPSGWRAGATSSAGDDKNFWRMAETGPVRPVQRDPLRPGRPSLRGARLHPGPLRDSARAGSRSGTSSSWSSTSSPDGTAGAAAVPERRYRAWASSASPRVLQGVLSNYDTDLFTPIHETLRRLLGHDPEAFEAERFSYQVIADHSRAVTFLIADGVLPSNEGRGYVLRRIMRRAVRHGRLLGRREPFLAETVGDGHRRDGRRLPVSSARARPDPGRGRARGGPVRADARRRHGPAGRGAGAPDGRRARRGPPTRGRARPTRRSSPGAFAFRLHDTYGFPIDLTIELAAEYGVRVDRRRLRGRTRRAARAEPRRAQGRAGPPRRADRPLRVDRPPVRRHGVPGLRDDRGRGHASSRSCATGLPTRS